MPTAVTGGRSVSTRFLRIPWRDWAAVVTGEKRMIRLTFEGPTPTLMPTPCVAYSQRIGQFNRQLMTLLSMRTEPLGAISPADVAAEGYESLSEFRLYWKSRLPRGRGWDPLQKVVVVEIRPWEPDDYTLFSEAIFDHIYGPWRP